MTDEQATEPETRCISGVPRIYSAFIAPENIVGRVGFEGTGAHSMLIDAEWPARPTSGGRITPPMELESSAG